MHGEKRKNHTETFEQQPLVNLSTITELKHGSGGKIKPICISAQTSNNNLSLAVAIVPGDSIRSNNKQTSTIESNSSCQMVSSVGFSTIDSICEQCDSNVYDNNGNITLKKKKSPVEIRCETKRVESKNTISVARSKTRKEPLPMKLRALPQSFWQQPNNTPSQSPGTLCPALPLLCKEEVAECITTDARTSLHPEELPTTSSHKEVVSDANTDLLFSLFRVVEEEQRRSQGEPKVTVVRRGRPKKPPRGALKDDDPCLVSTVTESLLPLLPERPCRDMLQARTAQGQQSPAVVSVRGERPATACITTTSTTAAASQNYSHLLSEVVFRL